MNELGLKLEKLLFTALCQLLLVTLGCLSVIQMASAQTYWEYVKAKKYWNPGYQNYQPASAELKSALIDNCMRSGGTISCTIEFGNETWVESDNVWDKWHFSFTQTRVATSGPGYPPYTTVTAGGGYVMHYCPADGGWTLGPKEELCYRMASVNPDCEECKANIPKIALPPHVGNPIFPSTLSKQEVRTDYENAQGTLRFIRTYRSDLNRWSHNYELSVIDLNAKNDDLPYEACYLEAEKQMLDRRCYPYAANGKTRDIAVRRGSGRILYFGSGIAYAGAVDVKDSLIPVFGNDGIRTGWQVKNGQTQAKETYDVTGRILVSQELNGQETRFTYSDATTLPEVAPRRGFLIGVTDAFGASLNFTYDSTGRLSSMQDPAGGTYTYSYDQNSNLSSVTYPDSRQISYLYNETGRTNISRATLLTGIIDENSNRYATFTYKDYKAVSTEHAGSVQKYSVVANNDTLSSVTDPLGTQRLYEYSTLVNGIKKITRISQPILGSTAINNRTIAYDSKGNVASTSDFDGQQTVYTYDLARNLPTKRVEGSGTNLARTISTEWHATLDLPTRIAEPKRLTTNTYDNNGNLLTQTVQATTDTTGATGFGAVVTGLPQTRTYTYNALGQRLTAKGPRTDVNDQTTYVYDNAGNLTSITNAAGHVTTLSNYDAHGRAGRITDPNGLHTDFSYTVRGWLSAVSKGSETTSYEYDGIGQLTKATLPDDSSISYTYDTAHRLTGIADTSGNSVAYSLDNMGNRTGEQVKDADGALVRKISRAYDALNRLKQITGALQ